MKKTVAAAVAAAFVVGASASVSAAANPFSDVPAGHWAYNSVSKLAAEGIIEGYGDGTYRGERNITRYEMAQMIAKAMAKNPTGANKAELDRLAAEFRDELDALGVRVAELEKYADKVVWTGELRYRYWNNKEDLTRKGDIKRSNNQLQLRLFPTATVNDHWQVKARLTASADMRHDTTSDVKLTYAFAEGVYDKLTLRVGKMPLFTLSNNGMIMDDFFSGGQIVYGDKFKVAVMAGRWDMSRADILAPIEPVLDNVASYQGAELYYGDRSDFFVGAGFHHFRSDSFKALYGYSDKKKNASIWTVGASYKFGGVVTLEGAYARNGKAREYKTAYNIELAYKGADKTQGSWGIGAAYRYLGQNVAVAPTYDTFWDGRPNKKGYEIFATWSPFNNTRGELRYFHGKTLDTKKNSRTLYGRFSWFF